MLFKEEEEKLKYMELRQKADHETVVAQTALDVQVLFNDHKKRKDENAFAGDGRIFLLLATNKGKSPTSDTFAAMAGSPPCRRGAECTCSTTTLYQMASHIQSCCVGLLLSASPNTARQRLLLDAPILCCHVRYTSTADLLVWQNTSYRHHQQASHARIWCALSASWKIWL